MVQWLGLHISTAAGLGSIPGQGAKVPQAEWHSQKKNNLKTQLPYDPAIPLLGIYLDKTLIQKDTCTPMFIEKH